MNNRKSANIYMMISIVMGYLLSYVVGKILGEGPDDALTTNVLNIINNVVVTGIPIAVYLIFNKRGFENSFKKIRMRSCVKYVVLIPVVWAASNYINIIVNSWLEKVGITHLQQLPEPDGAATVVAGFILACIVAPVFEEIFYRGVILSLLKGYGNGAAVVISALMFAFAHGSVTLVTSTFVCGIILGYVTIRSGSLLPAMIIHFGNNFISWAIQYCGGNETLNIATVLFMIIAGAASVIWALIKLVRQRKRVAAVLTQVWGYVKNPLWIPIVADFVLKNFLYHG